MTTTTNTTLISSKSAPQSEDYPWGECQFTFKVLLQGLSGTGKSQIFNRYLNDGFNKRHSPTYKAGFGVRFVRHMEKKIQL